MQPRSTRILVAFVACLGTLTYTLVSHDALAASKDAQAEKAYDQAMDEDYLNVEFDKAIGRLKKAISTCGKSDCSKSVLAKLYVGLGVIYGGGKNNNAQAKANFIKAFELDGNAKPVEDYMSPELKKIFEEAKKEAKPGAGGDDDDDGKKPTGDDDDGGKKPPAGDDDDDEVPAGGDIEFTPPKEGLINTPLPIFIKFPEDVGAKSARLRYKPFGGTKWMSQNMKPMAGGYGGEIPCGEITTTGDLKIYIIARDEAGDPIATAGTRKRPLTVDIKNKLSGDQPSFPGKKPPEQCVTAADCPPDFPGCEPTDTGGSRGDKGWGASCEDTKECRKGLVCLNGACEQGEGDDDDDDDSGPAGPTARSHYIWLGGGVDFLFLSSADKVCGEGELAPAVDFNSGPDNYFCYEKDGEFIGIPAKADNTNEVLGGGAFAGGRVLLGYDYMVWDGGLTVGARIGVGFSTAPSGAGDALDRADKCPDENNGSDATCRDPADKKFLLFHGEARAAYHIGGAEGFMDGLLRPYAFIGGGVGQVNAGVDVKICDRLDENGVPSTDDNVSCRNANAPNTRRTDVKAVQVTGLGFVDVGVGSIFAFHDNFGAFVELKAMFMVPTFGAVISPSVGPVALF